MLANQQGRIIISEDTRCRLEDLPRTINNRDRWRESHGNPCYQHDMMMKMRYIYVCVCLCIKLYIYICKFDQIINIHIVNLILLGSFQVSGQVL